MNMITETINGKEFLKKDKLFLIIGDCINKAFSYLSVVNDSIIFALRILISVNKLISKLEAILNHSDESYVASARIKKGLY